MNSCPQCNQVMISDHCVACAVEIASPHQKYFPPILWSEIRDHLVHRLMIDPQWMVENHDELTWWPTDLPQSIYVSSRVEIDPDEIPETLMRVTIESFLGTAVDRSKALESVADLMIEYPFGSIVVLDDNRVAALTSIALYGRNRPLLSLLHEEALLQATFAKDVSTKLVQEGVVVTDHPIHPTSGRREKSDELIQGVYGNEKFASLHGDTVSLREIVRAYWRKSMLNSEAELGFENEDVTFITFKDGFDCGVGWRDDEFATFKFGPTLQVWNNLATTKTSLTSEQMNSLNIAVALETEFGIGHLGGITQHQHEDWNSIKHIAALPHYFLQTTEHGLNGGIVTAFNGILQATASARYVHWLLNSDPE